MAKPRKNRQELPAEPTKKPLAWISRKAVLIALATSLGVGAAGFTVDRHFKAEYFGRFESFNQAMPEYRHCDARDKGPLDRIRFCRELAWRENELDKRIGEFSEYLSRNYQSVSDLTCSTHETTGDLLYDGKTFTFREETNINAKLSGFVQEILDGNFAHRDALVDFFDARPQALYALTRAPEMKEDPRLFEKTIHIYQVYVTDSADSQGRDIGPVAQSFLRGLKGRLDTTAMRPIQTVDDLCKPGVIARYHTHPRNNPNTTPSPADTANTLIAGPTVMISQANSTMHAYLISRGQWKEFYKAQTKPEFIGPKKQ